jgi:GWxTD domain-containing protein
MKTRSKTQFAAVAAAGLFAVALFAGGLSKFKGWDKSPQGDLMTSAERAEWANVRTDDDADKFVKDFVARRGPGFVTEVTRATAAADKYFSAGKVQGSRTERGKLVIILGPPGGLTTSEKQARGDSRSNVDSAMTVSGSGGGSGGPSGAAHPGGGGGAGVADMMGAANGAGTGSGVVHVVTFTYAASQLPAAYGKSLTVNVEIDGSGVDHIADKKTQAELDRLYEMVAETKLTPPAAH